MANKRDRDVHIYRVGSFWVASYQGRYLLHAYTQRVAITQGQKAAKARQCELVIHGADGRIRAKDSEGSDSPKRKG